MSDHDGSRARDLSPKIGEAYVDTRGYLSGGVIGEWGAIGEHGYRSEGAIAPTMPKRWELGLGHRYDELLCEHLGADESGALRRARARPDRGDSAVRR